MNRRKRVVACFVGGALCCAVALIVTPAFWWLGLIAGFVGGYLSYDLRQIFTAVPKALNVVARECAEAGRSSASSVAKWFMDPHPFLFFGLICSIPFIIREVHEGFLSGDYLSFVGGLFLCMVTPFVFGLALAGLARLGAEGEECYWAPVIWDYDINDLISRGYKEQPLTYPNLLHWTRIGVWIIIKFLVWTMWKCLAIGIVIGIWALCRFVWHMFVLIHSRERVLCAVDGTLGGAVGYLTLAQSATTLLGQVLLVLFCGIIGVAFGEADWEIVSKRLLHVRISNTPS